MCVGGPPIMADWPADRGVVIPEPRDYRGRAAVLARTTHHQPVEFPEESLEMLNDADCPIDPVIIEGVLEHTRWDDLAFRENRRVLEPGGYLFLQGPYAREKAAFAADPRGAIRVEREWPR